MKGPNLADLADHFPESKWESPTPKAPHREELLVLGEKLVNTPGAPIPLRE